MTENRGKNAKHPGIISALVWIALGFILNPSAAAEDSSNTSLEGSAVQFPDTIPPPVIQRIIVEPQNVFSDSLAERVWVYRLLNKFHARTKTHVVRRELLLKSGDRYDTDLAYETERTLRNLPYIYDAEVTLDSTNPDSITLRVRTIDKFSLSGGVQVSQQPGRSRVEVGARETNLLGLGHEVNLKYNFVDPDPDYFVGSYANPRAFGTFHRLDVRVNDNPFNRVLSAVFSRPFVHQNDRISYSMTVSNFRNRELKFINGDTTLAIFQEGSRVNLDGAYRSGDFHNKLVANARYSYVNLRTPDVSPIAPYTLNNSGELVDPRGGPPISVSLPNDSAFHFVGAALQYLRFSFERTNRLELQGRVEDVTLFSGGSILAGQARGFSLDNLIYNTWQASAFVGANVGNVLISGNLSRQGWLSGGAEIRSVTTARVSTFHNGLSWMTLASRFVFLSDQRIDRLDPLSVDESNGVRGYRENTLTGDRALVGNVEARLFSGIEVLSARIGGALHFDFGGTWDRARALRLDEMIWSAGTGVRLDLGQAGAGRVIRVDVTYAGQLNSWQISTGVGQYFGLLGR